MKDEKVLTQIDFRIKYFPVPRHSVGPASLSPTRKTFPFLLLLCIIYKWNRKFVLNHWNLHSTLFIRALSLRFAPFPNKRLSVSPATKKNERRRSPTKEQFRPSTLCCADACVCFWTTKLWENSKSIITQIFRIFGDVWGCEGVAGWHLIFIGLVFWCFSLSKPVLVFRAFPFIENHSSLKELFYDVFLLHSATFRLPPSALELTIEFDYNAFEITVKIKMWIKDNFTFVMTRI